MKRENVYSTLLGIIGVSLFTFLLIRKYLSSIEYTFLLGILAAVCLAIIWGSRLRELDLKNLKMSLDKYKKIKNDIYAKEEELKQVSVILSEIIAFNTSAQNRWSNMDTSRLRQIWSKKKIDELLKLLNVPESEKEKVFKYLVIYDNIDRSKDTKEISELSKKLDQTLKEDCGIT